MTKNTYSINMYSLIQQTQGDKTMSSHEKVLEVLVKNGLTGSQAEAFIEIFHSLDVEWCGLGMGGKIFELLNQASNGAWSQEVEDLFP